LISLLVDLRGRVSYTRYTLDFPILKSLSEITDQRYPDKQKLGETIHALRERGLSYRGIGAALGIYWTRIGLIIKAGD